MIVLIGWGVLFALAGCAVCSVVINVGDPARSRRKWPGH